MVNQLKQISSDRDVQPTNAENVHTTGLIHLIEDGEEEVEKGGCGSERADGRRSVGMIADACGSKDGAKVENTVGVVERPKGMISGWIYRHGGVGDASCSNELRHKEKQGDVNG